MKSMAMANTCSFASFTLSSTSFLPSISSSSFPLNSSRSPSKYVKSCVFGTLQRSNLFAPLAANSKICEAVEAAEQNPVDEMGDSSKETLLYSVTPLPLLFLAALPGAATVRSLFGPFVELVKSWNLPEWLVHWGHPGNMAVVLFAMGGYGTYLGFRIRLSDDVEEKAKAKDLHPKLLWGMFFFFALGATGGITSLLTSDKPILESPHAVTGLIGLTLLAIQSILPALFEGNPSLRNIHGILGTGIMTLFLVHFALGLQLGFSY